MTQITKISQITWMIQYPTVYPIPSQPLDSYHFQMNWIAKITLISQISLSYWFIIWAYDSDDQNFPNYPNNHEHLNDLSKLLR